MSEYGRRLTRIIHAPAGIIVAISVAALASLLALGGGQERSVHDAALLALRSIDVNSASLQRDVLRSRVGLLDDYTVLDRSVEELRSALIRLGTLVPRGLDSLAAQRELSQLGAAIANDEIHTSRFKSLNPSLRNSLDRFSEIELTLRDGADLECKAGLGELADRMHRFEASPTPASRENLKNGLDRYAHSSCPHNGRDQLLRHGVVLLSTVVAVDRIVTEIQMSRTLYHAAGLQEEYRTHYGLVSSRAYWARVGLLSIAIFLCGYISLLAFGLRRQTSRLEKRLRMEAVLKGMEVNFDAVQGVHAVGGVLTSSLDRLAHFLEASIWQCETIDVVTRSSTAKYGSPGNLSDALSPETREQFLSHVALRGPAALKRSPYRQVLQMPDGYRLGGGHSASGMALGIVTRDGELALFTVVFVRPRLALPAEEMDLALSGLSSVFEMVSACLEREERARLEQKLEHGERLQAVGRLAGGIAHEFNNILGAISGYGEMAVGRLRPGSKTRQYVQKMETTAKRGQYIVDQILTLSRRRQTAAKPFEAIEALTEAVAQIRVALPRNFSVNLELELERAIIEGNPFEFQQTLINLSRNAYEARIGEGSVTLRVRLVEVIHPNVLQQGKLAAGQYLGIDVADKGVGIRQSILPHIFEPFYTTRSAEGGTGLGLASVAGTVASMRGTIEVASELGNGTTFSLLFPLVDATPAALSDFALPTVSLKGRGEAIAIVHEEISQLGMYEESLAALGYEPFGFRAVSSLKRWLERAPRQLEAVLFDGEPAGVAALKSILPDTPMIVVTDHPYRDRVHDPMLFEAMLDRPVRPGELSEAIFRLMKSGRV